MEKIVNINFKGRVIAIEETACNTLKIYTDSLRRHFAGEESSDEIINDIEDRIAELLTERLKQGAPCIGMADLNAVMDSIGRLEDIEAAEGEEHKNTPPTPADTVNSQFRDRLYRSTDDKLIAGVCSGIAIRTGIDPTLVRILFVLLIGALFWIYILMWLIVPAKSIRSNVTKRLYRNPDDKMIAGVCGGLAAYFHMDSWILRTIFAIPFIIGVLSGDVLPDFDWGWGPRIFAGSFGGTLFLLYVILWIVAPYATSAADRMEMRGEKVDLNTIKAATQARMTNAANAVKPAGSSLARAIGIIFKAFFLFIGGIIALSLFAALIALVFAGTAALPYVNFLFDGSEQYGLAWAGIALTFGIPLLALIVFVVRRLMGVRSHRHYLGYIFAGLWLTGVTCAIIVGGTMLQRFSTRSVVEEAYMIQQPTSNKLYISVSKNEASQHHSRHDRWFGEWNDDDAPFRYINSDSLWLNNVKVNIEPSADSQFHIYSTRASRGQSAADARRRAEHVSFVITQQDSTIFLPDGFVIHNKDKFRVQQVLVTVEVPVGKMVRVSSDVNDYSWYNVNTRGHGHYERHWSYGRDYSSNTDYVMTSSGLRDPADTVQTTEPKEAGDD